MFDGDTLRMLEGALGVVDQVVSDVMVPRGQMVSLFVDTPFDEILKNCNRVRPFALPSIW